MTKQSIKRIFSNVTIYAGLAVLGAFAGQQLGQVITGHSFAAHATNQVNSAPADGTATNPEQQPEGLGPCNCPLCCHG